RALVVAGTGFAAGGLLLFLAVGAVRGYTLDGLPNDGDRAAAAAVYDALTSSLRTTSWVVLASGLAVAVVCWFAGTGRAGRLWPRRWNRVRRHR
ncbi:hypothetical protein GT042_27745, partial [Streptomyces sp. SID3212]|nr:hypothetical protein [Streptomyces sp. SID3212]